MSIEKEECYVVKQKDRVLKFCYDRRIGIYYQIHMELGWSEKRTVYKDCLYHFFVLGDKNDTIYIFCQDISGDIKLCILEELEINNRTLLFQKQNIIMPVNFKAFILNKNIHLLYNLINQYANSEILVHHPFTCYDRQSSSQIVAKLFCSGDVIYRVTQDSNDNVYLLTCGKADTYRLILRIFYSAYEKWGKEEELYCSVNPYVDFSLYAEKGRIHTLFITQEQKGKKVIYGNKNQGVERVTELFQDKDVDSCLLVVSNNYIWTFWVCGNKLYGAISIDSGHNFCKFKVYKQFEGISPIKIMFQDCTQNGSSSNYPYQVYAIKENGEIKLFLEEILVESLAEVMEDEQYIINRISSENTELDEIRAYFKKVSTKIEDVRNEKEELEQKFKEAESELINLKNEFKSEKNETEKIKYQISKEKDKNLSLQREIQKLVDKNIVLERDISSKDKELMRAKNKLSELERIEKNFKEQSQNKKSNEAIDSEEINKESKKTDRFSLIKWLLS